MTSQTFYLIIARHGRETFFVERDTNESCWSSTIHDLMHMQIDEPVRVIEVIPDEHWASDCTAKVCQEIADRSATKCEPLHRTLVAWIESHLGTRFANELKVA